MPYATIPGRIPRNAAPTVSRPPNAGSSPGLPPGGRGAPPGGTSAPPTFVKPPPSALAGGRAAPVIPPPTASPPGVPAAIPALAATGGTGVAAFALSPPGVIAVGGVAAILGTAAGSQAIAKALMPEAQPPLTPPPITTPAGGLRSDGIYSVQYTQETWFLNNRSDVSTSQSSTNVSGENVATNITQTINSREYDPRDGFLKQKIVNVVVTLAFPGTQPLFQPDFSAIPQTDRLGTFAPPLPIGLDGSFAPSVAPNFMPAPPGRLAPPVIEAPPKAPELPGIDPVKVPELVPVNPVNPELPAPPPELQAPAPRPNRPKLPTPFNPPIDEPLIDDNGIYFEPPAPPPEYPRLPTHRDRTTENCCIDPPPKQDDCCEEILEALEELKECACDEPKYVTKTQGLGGGRSLTADLPANTKVVYLTLTEITPNTRDQFGGGDGPNVVYAGWYAFGKGNAWGDRLPVSYAGNAFPCPEGYNRFSYTLRDFCQGSAIAEYEEEVEE